MLVDQFGREIKSSLRPSQETIGVASIRDRWGTYPSSGLTPYRLAQIFKEADAGDIMRQSELFEEMEEKDAHLASVLQTRKLAVTGLDWEILPAGKDSQAQKIADFCLDMVSALPNWDDNLFDALDSVGKGFSGLELKWENGKHAILNDMVWIHPKKFTIYNELIPRILTETNPTTGEEIPPFKLWWFRHKARSGYDTRAGILRVVGWMYLFKNYTVKDWVTFAEVFGMPLRIGKYEPGAGDADREALRQAVVNLGSDAAGIISKNTEIEFIEASKVSSAAIFDRLISLCDKQMSLAVLGQTATTEGTPGKLGGEEARSDVRQDLKIADCKQVSASFRQNVLRPIVGFNFGWDEPVPYFSFHYEESEDLEKLARTFQTLGLIPGYSIPPEYLDERFSIPRTTELALKNKGMGRRGEGETRRIVLEGDNPLTTEDINAEITDLKDLIAQLTTKLTPLELEAIMGKIGEQISFFQGDLKNMVTEELRSQLGNLISGTKTQAEVLKELTRFFSDPIFEMSMDAAARAELYLRNELKNVYTDTYAQTVQNAFPDEQLYAYASGPRDALTADDTREVEKLTNPNFGGTPLRWPDEYLNNPIVAVSRRPNDRNTDIIMPKSMLPLDVQRRVK